MKKIAFLLIICLSKYKVIDAPNCDQGEQNTNGGNHNPIIYPNPYGGDSIDVTQPVDPNEIIGPISFMSFTSISDTVLWVSAEQ